jgi:tripartite-type tricarboxylate transporter receptor subunit TctC
MVAMERGEVQASSTSWTAIKVGKKHWLAEKKIKIILQTAPERAHDLQDAPSLPELGSTPEDKQVFALYASGSAVGRTLMGPPDIPAERVKMLRDAFQATMKDPEFLADAARLAVDVEPLTGEQVAALVQKTLALPDAVRQRAEAAFGRK